MCSIIGVGERPHKVLGQIDLSTLDSGERSLPFGLLVFKLCIGIDIADGWFGIANGPISFINNRVMALD